MTDDTTADAPDDLADIATAAGSSTAFWYDSIDENDWNTAASNIPNVRCRMSGEATSLLQQALNLSADERYEVAERLLDSLEGDDRVGGDQAFWDEIARRSDEAHAHPERLLDGKQVMDELREHLRRKRGQ